MTVSGASSSQQSDLSTSELASLTQNDNPPRFSADLLANFLGKGWAGIVSLAAVPIYVQLLGVESYGLIGLSTTFAALVSLLDFGLGTIVIQEFSFLSVRAQAAGPMRNLLCTLERVYWGVALLVGALIALFAGIISEHWLNTNRLSIDSVRHVILLIGLTLACQWPLALYAGGMAGLQAQIPLNFVQAGFATLRAFGAVVILLMISSSIEAFFLWQALVGAAQTMCMACMLRSRIPQSRGCFQRGILRRLLPLSLRMSGVGASAIVFTQIDKVVLSRLLSLELFGYYTLATTIASALSYVIAPVSAAVFPRLMKSYAKGDLKTLEDTYHMSCRLLSLLIIPVAAVVAVFSAEVLLIWTQNDVLSARTAPIVVLLLAGASINGLLTLPYLLQLSGGSVGPVLPLNIAAALLMIPMTIMLTLRFGAIGGAIAWLVLNAIYMLVAIPLIHRNRLPGASHTWYVRDVAPAVLAAFPILLIAKLLMPSEMSMFAQLCWIGGTYCLALIGSARLLPGIWSRFQRVVTQIA